MKSFLTSKSNIAERQLVWNTAIQYGIGKLEAHTSGSTGIPKAISLPDILIAESLRRSIEYFELTPDSHLHSCVSARFIGGKMMVCRAVALGCRFTFENPSNRPEFPREDPIDLLAIVPSMAAYIIERKKKNDLPPIRYIICGGAPLSQALRSALYDNSLPVYETYGMTETASHVALRRVSHDPNEPFRLLPGVTATTDRRGCIILKIKGIDNPIITNDLVKLISEKEFILKGRADNVIISGGMKVIPEDVEARIGHLISGEFIISSVFSEKWGEEVILILDNPSDRRDPDSGERIDENLLINSLSEIDPLLSQKFKTILAPHEIPRRYAEMRLKRTLSGKIIRKG